MKRPSLRLKSETVRVLTPNALVRAAGGFTSDLFDKQSDRYDVVARPVPVTTH